METEKRKYDREDWEVEAKTILNSRRSLHAAVGLVSSHSFSSSLIIITIFKKN